MKKLDKRNIENILALTPMQEGMLFHYLKDPESDIYFEQLSLEISGKIDIKCFEQAWNFVIQTNEMLRTVFRWEEVEKPVQIILKEHRLQLEYIDFSGKTSTESQKLVERLKSGDRNRKFNLHEVPFRVTLCKIQEKKYIIIISNHHILYDGWSSGIILKEFLTAYDGLSNGKELIKAVSNGSHFKEFVKWMQDRDIRKQEKFWKEYLAGFDTGAHFPAILWRRKAKTPDITENFPVTFDKHVTARLDNLVKEHKITLASLFYTAWGLLLQRYTNCRDVVFGTTVAGRPAQLKGIENVVGLFINTVPLRVQNHNDEKIASLLYRINHSLKIRKEYESISLVKIIELGKGLFGGPNRELFDSIVVFDNYPLDKVLSSSASLSVDSYSVYEMTHYDLTIGIDVYEEITVNFSYSTRLLDEESIEQLSVHFASVLMKIIKDSSKTVGEIDILSVEEKNKILYTFNNTGAVYPKNKTIHQLFEEQVERVSDKVAVVGPAGGLAPLSSTPVPVVSVTYSELNQKANQLAHLLREKGVEPGDIVGIMVPRSLEMVAGMLGILKAGGAYLPINKDSPEDRTAFMMADSNAKVLLTNLPEGHRFNCQLSIVNYQLLMSSQKAPFHHSSFIIHHSSNLAYVIYTSGSTGRPKGVLVEHSNVVNLLAWFGNTYNLQKGMHVLLLSDYTFDPSVEDIFGSLVHGAVVYITSRDLVSNKEDFHRFIDKHQVHMINFVPGFLKELLSHGKKLESLQVVISGGERLEEAVKDAILGKGYVLYNHYGPTEITVDALVSRCSAESVTIGKPIANAACYILDRYNRLAPIGVTGELCIGGAGVANGYMNNPELTAEKFIEFHRSYRSYRSYRSGDLARWLPDGNIEFLGRMDNQVKIRGHRIELQEIEKQLLKHQSITDAVVIDRETRSGEKYLCAYIVDGAGIGLRPEPRELREFLYRILPSYMIPSYFVVLEKIPLTLSGKPDKKALPTPEIKVGETSAAPRDEIEKKLAELWYEVLGVQVSINIDDNFFALGGHSLNATTLASRIHRKLDIKIPLVEIFKNPSIRRMAEYIKCAVKERFVPLQPVEKKEYYTLSPMQTGLYAEQYREISFTGYNSRVAVKLVGELDKDRAQKAFTQLIQRHEILRTSFMMMDDQPVQRIHDKVEFEIEYYLATEDTRVTEEGRHHHSSFIIHHLVRQFIRPFDLSQAPLFRVGLIMLADQEHILILDIHHIISDAPSAVIFEREFLLLYRDEAGGTSLSLRIQYKDFSQWQHKIKQGAALKKQEEYWLGEFTGELPVLNLPLDYPRTLRQTFEADIVGLELNEEELRGLNQLASRGNATMFMVLLAVFNVLLAKWCDQPDIVVGAPVANRQHSDLDGVIGYFVNMLVLRNYLHSENSFKSFLDEVIKRTLKAYENQDYQYDDLVTKLFCTRDSARNSLVDVVFASQNLGVMPRSLPEMEIPGLKIMPYENRVVESPFDLALYADDSGKKLELLFYYKVKLFKRKTIERLVKNFREILSTVLEDAGIKIKDIEISHGLLVAAARDFQEDQGDFGY